MEPDTWDICTNFKEASNPHCIDDIMRPFYDTNSSILAVQDCTHIIDTFAGKTKELIIMESDPAMISWLQEWKQQIVDMAVENKFES